MLWQVSQATLQLLERNTQCSGYVARAVFLRRTNINYYNFPRLDPPDQRVPVDGTQLALSLQKAAANLLDFGKPILGQTPVCSEEVAHESIC
jgi:hypothetical protein